jgi:Homeodomain-like domain
MNGWGDKRSLVSESTVSRWQVIEQFEERKISRREAAQVLEITERQFTRIRKKYLKGGAIALEHALKNIPPPNKTKSEISTRIAELLKNKYYGFNLTHAWEMMVKYDEVTIGYDVIKRLGKSLGITKVKERKGKIRKLRKRYPSEGFMLQMDGSEHRWFEGKMTTIISMIDDATSEVYYGEFVENENLEGVLSVVRKVIEIAGIPRVLYVDRARNFGWLKDGDEAQFSRVCRELGIKVIYAFSAEGKGRIERTWGTLQDRLVSEFRLFKIKTMSEATKYFNEKFIPETWRLKFTVKARNEARSWLPSPTANHLDQIFCLKYERKVRRDHCIQWENEWYLIQSSLIAPIVGHVVQIRIYEKGLWKAFYAGRELELEKARSRPWDEYKRNPNSWRKAKVEVTSLYK